MSNRRPPISGRKGEKHVDDVRPTGCYYASIQAHKKFSESLGNGTITINHEQALKNAEQQEIKPEEKTGNLR